MKIELFAKDKLEFDDVIGDADINPTIVILDPVESRTFGCNVNVKVFNKPSQPGHGKDCAAIFTSNRGGQTSKRLAVL